MNSLERLLQVMARLRDPQSGCPWDVAQDWKSIAPHTIEEAYEVADAVERGEKPAEVTLEMTEPIDVRQQPEPPFREAKQAVDLGLFLQEELRVTAGLLADAHADQAGDGLREGVLVGAAPAGDQKVVRSPSRPLP